MKLQLVLDRPAARAATLSGVAGLCGWLLYVTLSDFLVGALADERVHITVEAAPAAFITAPFKDDRVGVNPTILAAASRYFPESARIHMRLAGIRRYTTEDDLRVAEFHARRAKSLSPHDYRPRLQLGYIQEFKENLEEAEEATRQALKLASGNLEAHWLLASILASRGKLNESLGEFLAAASGNADYLQPALKRVWRESAQNVNDVRRITPDRAKDRLELARFLFNHSRVLESAAVFRQIDPEALLNDRDSGAYLDDLIAAGHTTLAHELWSKLFERNLEAPEDNGNSIWNGGFESDILLHLAQFDWSIRPTKYARISVDSQVAHSGHRSLRIDFNGQDTTRLEDQIQQLAMTRRGSRYRLQYYVKSAHLTTPEGPRVVVSGIKSQESIAASDPAPMGSTDWEPRKFEFAASSPVLVVRVKQHPQFSYEEPTSGTVWFDDFEIREIPKR